MNEYELKLKFSAMKEAFGTVVANYEEKVAELRVQLTLMSQAKDSTEKSLQESNERITQLEQEIEQNSGRQDDSQEATTHDDTA